MAAPDYSVDELVRRVRRTLQLRSNNAKLTELEIVQVCDEEIQQNLFPMLMRVREDYQVERSFIALTNAVGAYRVPAGASSTTIDHIDIVEFSGATVLGARMLDRLETPAIADFTGAPNGMPAGWVLMGDTIQLLPTPDATTASTRGLSVYYDGRPSQLVLSSDCLQVVSCAVDTDPNLLAIEVDGTIGTMGLADGDAIDIVPAKPPMMPFIRNATLSDISGDPTLLIFPGYTVTAAALAPQIAVGSWITPPGQTNIFPLPDAWWSASVLACAASAAMQVSDAEAHGSLRGESIASIERLVALQSSRVRKQPHATFNRNSPMRRTGRVAAWSRYNG